MANERMEVDIAEEKLKAMEHSEQHYFKRYGSYLVALSCFFAGNRLGQSGSVVSSAPPLHIRGG